MPTQRPKRGHVVVDGEILAQGPGHLGETDRIAGGPHLAHDRLHKLLLSQLAPQVGGGIFTWHPIDHLGVVTRTYIGQGLFPVELHRTGLVNRESAVGIEGRVGEVDRDPTDRVHQRSERDEIHFHVVMDGYLE